MLRNRAVSLAVVALVATVPVPCPCPEETTAPPSGHECCAPPAGVSANDHGCCDVSSAPTGALVPGPAAAPPPAEVTLVRLEPLARREAPPLRSVVLTPSPPPATLRL